MIRSLCLILALAPAVALAQLPYPTSPDWTSTDTEISTGAALVDLDRDGWLDLVVANGNDIYEEHVVVYYNRGDGTLPGTPDWASADTAYHGHLDVADVNGDGWQDVAVAILGEFNTIDNAAKLYLNNSGSLSSLPDWESDELANAFGCAFGDVNNDGRPDLAVGTGWSYGPRFYHDYVYVNSGGTLPTSATWSPDDQSLTQGVLWTDANRDGWLDLVAVPADAETAVYLNLGGTLETAPSWQTTDSSGQDAIMATAGDVTGDGLRDLFVTDNTQLGGSGLFRQYAGAAGGLYETTYSWSYFGGYGSAVALADVDGDGDLDLATGGWWDRTRLFLNTAAGLPVTPDWSSTPSSVIEKIVFADVDRDGEYPMTVGFVADGRRLFYLLHQPVQDVVEVRVDGVAQAPSTFTWSREAGWLTTATTPMVTLEVDYIASCTLDMAVTNWDGSVGNFLYYNRTDPFFFADAFESGDTTAWARDTVGRR
jgi:hypothetical protein